MTLDTPSLRDLGWSPVFQAGLDPDELAAAPVRVAAVHRNGFDVIGPGGARRIAAGAALPSAEVAVGDWLLLDAAGRPLRRLERKSLIARRAAGTGAASQLIAANLDTLFIVSSCNADFSLARLERYLAVARQAEVMPVVVLTRADACPDPDAFVERARALGVDGADRGGERARSGLGRAAGGLVRPRRDGGACRVVGGRQVDADQRPDRRGAAHAAASARTTRAGATPRRRAACIAPVPAAG